MKPCWSDVESNPVRCYESEIGLCRDVVDSLRLPGQLRVALDCGKSLLIRHKLHRLKKAAKRQQACGALVGRFSSNAKAAELGDTSAMMEVARDYIVARCVPRSFGAAAYWLGRAADGGQVEALVHLAKLHLAGFRDTDFLSSQSTRSDTGSALTWAERAAAAGIPEGKALLASLIVSGQGAESAYNLEDVELLLTEAASAGDPSGCLQLALLRLQHDGREDHAAQIPLLSRAADAGIPIGLYLMGVACESGDLVRKDGDKAISLYRAAAQAGLPYAKTRLGAALLAGRHVARDVIGAERWLLSAARTKDSQAMTMMGDLRAGLDGLPPDFTGAISWFRSAMDLGNTKAARLLGLLQFLGLGTDEDERAAAIYFARAGRTEASNRDPAALICPGGLDLQWTVSATGWFGAAALKGCDQAAYRLGVSFGLGVDDKPDLAESARWLTKAGDRIPKARLRLQQLRTSSYIISNGPQTPQIERMACVTA